MTGRCQILHLCAMELQVLKSPFRNQSFQLRLATESDVPELRLLVNEAYKELADLGFNYTATYQDEKVTLQRIQSGRAFILTENNVLVATVLLSEKNYFTNRRTAYVGQLGVKHSYKRLGLGSLLMDHCEQVARSEGFPAIQLDTAKPALHLVRWYEKRGYEVVGSMQWEGKTYESFIFEKNLS